LLNIAIFCFVLNKLERSELKLVQSDVKEKRRTTKIKIKVMIISPMIAMGYDLEVYGIFCNIGCWLWEILAKKKINVDKLKMIACN
jgi:hypothetical protein